MELLYSLKDVLWFVFLVLIGIGIIEGYLYTHFKFFDKKWFLPSTIVLFPILALILLAIIMPLSLKNSFAFLLAFFAAQTVSSLVFKYIVKGRFRLPYLFLAPAFIGLGLLLLYPFFFEVYLSFFDLKLTTIMAWKNTGKLPFVGFRHYIDVFITSPLSDVSFWQLFLRTIWWTFINVFFHVLGGFILALLLNNHIRFKGIYRTFLIVPWAMPQVVAVLAMRGEFHSQYGFVNILISKVLEIAPFLSYIGVAPLQWLSNHPLATCTIINIWLGIPFMMIVILGGLQSISQSYYDAASIDGASYFQKLFYITVPLVKPVLLPAMTLGAVWTFNNINVIYLVTGQAGGTEQADILVSALYKAAFTYNRYSYSAAFAIIVFIILFLISVFWLKTFDAAKSDNER